MFESDATNQHHNPEFNKLFPEEDRLTRMNRDFRFHPAATTDPQALTREQIEAFNRDGFISPLDLFSEAEIANHRSYFDELLARVLASGQDNYSIKTAHLLYGKVYDLLTDRRIVAYVKDLLGENVVGWGSHYFCKLPGDGKTVGWHQDAGYWPLTPTKAVTVWLAIDDADRENACMKFIPGSHHFGHLTYQLTEESDPSILNQVVPEAENFGAPVYNELCAGQMSIHSDLLLHGSEANASTRRRNGLAIRYTTADVRADMDWNQKGVLVSGSDLAGHWSNPQRPAND
ncbi:MAG: phytanoyl-CoA dioxygenase family protein [Acidobacteriota bacterium]|nr:phytanoyl-CoA dioxygenase family protein [Acidobacteriota bacterium]